jgi:uncharacterized membrane protein YjjP (DUF1212 family)
MTDRPRQSQFLADAGRLLLEYNDSTRAIVHSLTATSNALSSDPCRVAVTYGSITVALGDDPPTLRTVPELRLNAAVQTRTHEVLDLLRDRQIDLSEAGERLARVERDTPRHSRWLVALLLGAGACSFARLLGADAIAIAVSGLATALGLLVRQDLGRRHFSLLSLPLAAACLGAVLGGIAIRLGWTQTPELVLVVPALMIVPGPHLLNGLFDLMDNQVSMGLSRLGLAAGLLIASALGIVIGARLTLPSPGLPERPPVMVELTLASDMALAGIATCGFAAFFNSSWQHVSLAAIGGMAGHGLRYAALQNGIALDAATCLGGLVVGTIAAVMAQRFRAPVAVIAFAGAVTMIPGSSFYRALGGALRLARLKELPDTELISQTLVYTGEAILVVGGLALGLVLGIRGVSSIDQVRKNPKANSRVTE